MYEIWMKISKPLTLALIVSGFIAMVASAISGNFADAFIYLVVTLVNIFMMEYYKEKGWW